MTVSVVVPYRTGCPYRQRAWELIRSRWEAKFPAWQVVTAEDGSDTWRKGAAVRRGCELATGEIVVVADADVWCPEVAKGVELVAEGKAAWAMPFRRVIRLTERATERVHLGAGLDDVACKRSSYAEPPYPQLAAGGMVVLRREAALAVPMDPRFVGWGSEDIAWRDALYTLAGPPMRLGGQLFHLWHPPAPRLTRTVGSRESDELRRRYAGARGQPSVMRAILAEFAG